MLIFVYLKHSPIYRCLTGANNKNKNKKQNTIFELNSFSIRIRISRIALERVNYLLQVDVQPTLSLFICKNESLM